MTNYVLGFAFSRDKKEVVLMEKQKPDWQVGKFNGVGGKMNENELPHDAMIREFREETGVEFKVGENPMLNWRLFATIKGEHYTLFCFRIFSDKIYSCHTAEDEEVSVMRVKTALGNKSLIPNLRVLIPMALDEDFKHAEIATDEN